MLKFRGYGASEDEMVFSDEVEVDLSKIDANLAGPKRPQDKIALQEVKDSFEASSAADEPE
jgi:aconitate hydratase